MVYDGLTPEVVAEKRFTPVRGNRDGYDMEEVDIFLDEVERSITLLNATLASKEEELTEAQASAKTFEDDSTQVRDAYQQLVNDYNSMVEDYDKRIEAMAAGGTSPIEPTELETALEPEASADFALPLHEDVIAPAEATSVQTPQVIEVRTLPEAGQAAARLLESATRTAMMTTEEAEAEAAELRSTTEADVKKLRADAHADVEAAKAEVAELRTTELAAIEKDRNSIVEEVEKLKAFETSFRGELTGYLNSIQERVAAPLTDKAETEVKKD